MRRILGPLAAALALVHAGAAFGAEPRVLFSAGEIERDAADGRTIVRAGLVQLELAPGIVVSAATGAEFRLGDFESGQITVARGEVLVVALREDVLYRLGEGRYRLQPDGSATLVRDIESGGILPDALANRAALPLADSVMLRQNAALQLNARQFARGLFSPFRPGR